MWTKISLPPSSGVIKPKPFVWLKNLTTPKAILYGLGLIALAIASVPYSSQIIKPAFASSEVHKIALCEKDGLFCANITKHGGYNYLRIINYD